MLLQSSDAKARRENDLDASAPALRREAERERPMLVFLTGANGYIAGAAAVALVAAGHRVRGLVRDRAKADMVAAHGVEPVIGSLDDAALLHEEARAADAVVQCRFERSSRRHRGFARRVIRLRQAFIPSQRLEHRPPISPWATTGQTASFMKRNRSKPVADKAARVGIEPAVLRRATEPRRPRGGAGGKQHDLRPRFGAAGAERAGPGAGNAQAKASARGALYRARP